MLNKDARIELERILSLDIHEMTADDIGFLRARRGYLNSDQKEKFAQFLEGLEPAEEAPKNLQEMKRQELDVILQQIGLNPADYVNKAAAVEAIEKNPRPRTKPDTTSQKADYTPDTELEV